MRLTFFILFASLIGVNNAAIAQCDSSSFAMDSCHLTRFDDDNIACFGPMHNGQKHGYWLYFANNGQTWMKVLYIEGEFVSDVNYLESAPGQAGVNTWLTGWNSDYTTMNQRYWTRYLILHENRPYPLELDEVFELRNTYRYKPSLIAPERTITTTQLIENMPTYVWDTAMAYDNAFIEATYVNKDGTSKMELVRSDLFRNGVPMTIEYLKQNDQQSYDLLKYGDGEWISYDANGNFFACVNFTDGVPDGCASYYDENGRERVCGNYENGSKNGVWEEYHPNGSLHRTYTYQNDTIAGKYLSYYDDGTVKLRCYITQAVPGYKTDGSFTTGMLFDDEWYKFIGLQGPYTVYTETGKVYFTTTYENPVVLNARFVYGGKTKGTGNTSILTGTDQVESTDGKHTKTIKQLNHPYDVNY